ncbi:AAC(3) family N-acetyltransferase [Vibrio sp. SS-MA-C1-2]|uniref:AAC(3) family N-acetyltransferase n=1 Tax=Vibrio sp. SS-MA-C1-2 TaxID=2908646 RepID=UPI001F3038E3|nr:AAC(3) family N-acetyltransferase [Vibrio sp. SS-MA-C1-2]UJF20044.1 AAC(3) family N-acetyltransferase [Vibrio sp. SS-MA-C1-2]
MHTRTSLLTDLSRANIDPTRTLVVHSSMKSLGDVEGGADTVLDALIEYMQDGWLIFPTHSWHETSNPNNIFNPETEPSCVGILSELFRQRPNVLRSLHPTHSVAILGKDTEQFIANEEECTTPCPREGVWGKLYDIDAQILFIGCDLSKNTFIHSIEEWHYVPHRLTKFPTQFSLLHHGERHQVSMFSHQSPVGDISLKYRKLTDEFLEKKAAKSFQIADADCLLASAKKMAEITESHLNYYPNFFAE